MIDPPGPERSPRTGNGDATVTRSGRSPATSTAAGLQSEVVEAFREILSGVTEVALTAFPLHTNAGDSLIWLGQLALLDALGIGIRLVGEQSSHDGRAFDALPPDVPVLISGGGNFGDLWPEEHQYREKVISDSLARRVIQLPQSFCFREPANLAATQKVVARHPDIVLTWRDLNSYEAALKAFPQTPSVLVPDIAFALGEMTARPDRQWPIVCISRTDQEGGELRAVPVPEGCQADWYRSMRLPQKLGVRVLRADTRLERRLLPENTRQLLYRRHAAATVEGAVRVVSTADVVVSDRLHAHVLCTMLGIPHVMVDTRYGKVRAFIETWTYRNELVDLADSPAHALDQARRRLPARVQRNR